MCIKTTHSQNTETKKRWQRRHPILQDWKDRMQRPPSLSSLNISTSVRDRHTYRSQHQTISTPMDDTNVQSHAYIPTTTAHRRQGRPDQSTPETSTVVSRSQSKRKETKTRPHRRTRNRTSHQQPQPYTSRRVTRSRSANGDGGGDDDDDENGEDGYDDDDEEESDHVQKDWYIPFQPGHLQTPVHHLDDIPNHETVSRYCFLCATSKETSHSEHAIQGEYGKVDKHKIRVQRLARSEDYERLVNMITTNIGRMDEECLRKAVQCFYNSNLKPYVPGKPSWPLRVIREHIRDHELNQQWQAWTAASDLRTLIRINLSNGVCVVQDGTNTASLDIPKVKLHIQLLRQLDREVKKANSSTN
jgi:hypothetical protein